MTPEQAALDIYLVYEAPGYHTHFTAQLIRLIAKSDSSNRRRIAQSFPIEVSMWEEWHDSPTTEEFYKHYGIDDSYRGPPKTFRSKDDPIPEDLREVMNDIAGMLDGAIKEHADRPMGFLLLTFDFGENGTLSYISNAQRDDILSLLEEFLHKNGR